MHGSSMELNDKVTIMRQIALSLNDEHGDWKTVFIPSNDVGIAEGYYEMRELLYFLADMFEE